MSEPKVQYKGGVGILGWMFLIFLTLKLTGYISWSWWWVTAPLWAPLGIVLGVAVLCGLVWFVAYLVEKKENK